MTAISDREQLSYIAAQAADARVNVEIETEGMTLNIGPQHPATHGTLRIVAKLDGEQVIAADPIMGYMHRGYEKLAEVRTYPQVTTLINRIDWVGSFANEVPFNEAQRRCSSLLFQNRLLLISGKTRRTGVRGVSVLAENAWDLRQLWLEWEKKAS